VIADLGINHVERQVLLAGFTVEHTTHDYGIDLLMFTYDRQGEIEWGEIFLQVKASDHTRVVSAGKAAAVRIQHAHLGYWLKESTPVILVMYDVKRHVAYWVYVQAYFQKNPGLIWESSGDEMIVHIPKRQVLNPKAVRRFAEFRDRILQQRNQGVRHEE
jgi:Domain of unknown function (DUF4365)